MTSLGMGTWLDQNLWEATDFGWSAEEKVLGLPLAVALERGGLRNCGHHLVTRGGGVGEGSLKRRKLSTKRAELSQGIESPESQVQVTSHRCLDHVH